MTILTPEQWDAKHAELHALLLEFGTTQQVADDTCRAALAPRPVDAPCVEWIYDGRDYRVQMFRGEYELHGPNGLRVTRTLASLLHDLCGLHKQAPLAIKLLTLAGKLPKVGEPYTWVNTTHSDNHFPFSSETAAKEFAAKQSAVGMHFSRIAVPLYEAPPTGFTEQDREMLQRCLYHPRDHALAAWAQRHLDALGAGP